MHHSGLPEGEVSLGPALRFAIDLADPTHARVGLAGGQSGSAGSPHYDDALRNWLEARPGLLWMHWSDVDYHSREGIWEIRPQSDA